MEIKKFNLDSDNFARLTKLLTNVFALGMDISGYGELALNENSNNLYAWAEDYPFTPFVDEDHNFKVCYSCPYCGHEFIQDVDTNEISLDDIHEWIDAKERNDGEHCTECEVEEE